MGDLNYRIVSPDPEAVLTKVAMASRLEGEGWVSRRYEGFLHAGETVPHDSRRQTHGQTSRLEGEEEEKETSPSPRFIIVVNNGEEQQEQKQSPDSSPSSPRSSSSPPPPVAPTARPWL